MEHIPCDSCHSSSTNPYSFATSAIALQSPYMVVHCQACGLAFMNPRMTAEEYRQFYSGQEYLDAYGYDDLLARSRVHEFNRTLDRMAAQQSSPGRLLDVGTATGEFLVAARQRGWEVAGTEISASSIKTAKERHNLDILPGWLDQVDLPEHSFDVIHLSHVLEHVPSPQATLTSVKRLLKPKGLVVIEVPHEFDNWFVRLARMIGRYQPAKTPSMHHVYFFTPATLRSALHRAGLAGSISTYSLDIPYRHFPQPARIIAGGVARVIDHLGGGIYIQALVRPMTTSST